MTPPTLPVVHHSDLCLGTTIHHTTTTTYSTPPQNACTTVFTCYRQQIVTYAVGITTCLRATYHLYCSATAYVGILVRVGRTAYHHHRLYLLSRTFHVDVLPPLFC